MGSGRLKGSTVPPLDPSDVTGGEGLFLAIAALSEKVPDGDFGGMTGTSLFSFPVLHSNPSLLTSYQDRHHLRSVLLSSLNWKLAVRRRRGRRCLCLTVLLLNLFLVKTCGFGIVFSLTVQIAYTLHTKILS